MMSETWIEEKGWGKIKDKLPRGYIWRMQAARRRKRKGRAIGGMIMGIKKELVGGEEEGEREREEIIVGRMRTGKLCCKIVGIYVNGDMERKLEELREWMEEEGSGIKTIIGGDFNARTGTSGDWVEQDEGEGEEEGSKGQKDKRRGEKDDRIH